MSHRVIESQNYMAQKQVLRPPFPCQLSWYFGLNPLSCIWPISLETVPIHKSIQMFFVIVTASPLSNSSLLIMFVFNWSHVLLHVLHFLHFSTHFSSFKKKKYLFLLAVYKSINRGIWHNAFIVQLQFKF